MSSVINSRSSVFTRISQNIAANKAKYIEVSQGTVNSQKCARRVMITGASGRLGGEFISALNQTRKVEVFSTSRSSASKLNQIQITFKENESQLKKIIEVNKLDCIVNCAAQSTGSYEEMYHSNVTFPTNLAKVSEEMGVPFIQMSSTAALYPVSCECGYAFTKKQAEENVMQYANAKLIRLDALIGCDSKLDIGYLAKMGKYLGLSFHFDDLQGSIIQPTLYESASRAIARYIVGLLDGKDMTKYGNSINIAGHPLEINELIRICSDTKFKFTTNLSSFVPMAAVVNSGALTPEFIRMAVIAKENPLTICTKTFEELHGEPIPTIQHLVETINQTVSFRSYITQGHKILGENPNPLNLIRTVKPIWLDGTIGKH